MLGSLAVTLKRVILRIMRERFVASDVSVLVVACSDDVGNLAVEPFEAMARPLPHLSAGLVEHIPIHDEVLVLLNKIARKEHGLDVEVLDVVGNPSRRELEKRLVDVVFRVALRVSEYNESERLRIVELLPVGSVLSICRR